MKKNIILTTTCSLMLTTAVFAADAYKPLHEAEVTEGTALKPQGNIMTLRECEYKLRENSNGIDDFLVRYFKEELSKIPAEKRGVVVDALAPFMQLCAAEGYSDTYNTRLGSALPQAAKFLGEFDQDKIQKIGSIFGKVLKENKPIQFDVMSCWPSVNFYFRAIEKFIDYNPTVREDLLTSTLTILKGVKDINKIRSGYFFLEHMVPLLSGRAAYK